MMKKHLVPSFFIIGERKCGTSSLYRYLLHHPAILPCKVKEPQFFSKPSWYRTLFFKRYLKLFPAVDGNNPVNLDWLTLSEGGRLYSRVLEYPRLEDGGQHITGEASANYFAQADQRHLYKAFPRAKCILLLRNPVDRAVSHYKMFLRFAAEGRNLPFALNSFEEDAMREIVRWQQGKKGYFIPQGLYFDQLMRWREVFTQDQFKLILTEQLENADAGHKIMHQLCDFLHLDQADFSGIISRKFNVDEQRAHVYVTPDFRRQLTEFYRPSIEKLEDYLQYSTGWLK